MTRPLELKIYCRPKMKRHHQGPAPYLDMASGDLTSQHAAEMFAGAKRFIDTELAAEYEAARCDSMLLQHTEHVWAPLGETWSMKPNAIHDRAQTLLRFATHPHYFEEQE